MSLFKKTDYKKLWIALFTAIPFLIIVVYNTSGKITIIEIAIILLTILVGILSIYIIKWISNKKS